MPVPEAAAGSLRRMIAVVAGTLVATAMVACGGGSEPGAGTSATDVGDRSAPAAGGDVSLADPYCSAAQRRQERIRRGVGGDQLTLDDRARLLVDLAPERVRLAEALATIEPPEGRRAEMGELLRAARARGAASTRAGRLWKRGAPEERIAAAAAREHDERLRFVEAARTLGLRECAERLSGAERERLEATLGRALTSAGVRRRCSAFGERYLEQEFDGAADACAASARPPLRADRVQIRELQGMDGVFAVAQIEVEGGDAPGRYRARITYEDGVYRVDKLD